MAIALVMGEDLLKQLCKVVGIEYGQCRRLILDIDYNRAVTAYASTFATPKIDELDWEVGLTKIETE